MDYNTKKIKMSDRLPRGTIEQFSRAPTYDNQGVSLYYPIARAHPVDSRLTVPRLRLGALSDIVLSQEVYATHENGLLYRGLQEYMRTVAGRRNTPAYIVDNHNHALFTWVEAFHEGSITKGAILLRFDTDGDDEYPENPAVNIADLHETCEYVVRLRTYDFIAPALESGLVSNVIWVNPAAKNIYRERPRRRVTIPLIYCDPESQQLKEILEGKYSPEQLIVDIDVDFLSPT